MRALRLIVRRATLVSGLDRQVVVLGLILGGASVVALRVSHASVGALLLYEDALQTGSCAAICHHHLLGAFLNWRVVNAA